jgi:hypothetical protein
MTSRDGEPQASPEPGALGPGTGRVRHVTLADLEELDRAATDLHQRITDHLDRLSSTRPTPGDDERATA